MKDKQHDVFTRYAVACQACGSVYTLTRLPVNMEDERCQVCERVGQVYEERTWFNYERITKGDTSYDHIP
jgi:hypothetical protein